jgi:PAS domain S-box-containing protein
MVGPAHGGTVEPTARPPDRQLESDELPLDDVREALRRERARHEEIAALGLLSLQGEADRATVIQQALEALRRLLPCDYVALAEVGEEELRILAATDPGAVGERIPRAGSLTDLAVRTGEPLRTDDLRDDPRLAIAAHLAEDDRMVAGWSVPMRVGTATQALGCITREPWKDRADSESFLQAIANILIADAGRRAAESAARTDEQRFRRLAENVPDAVFHVRLRPTLRVEYLSPRFAELTGVPVEELTADPDRWRQLVPDEDLAQIDRTVRTLGDDVVATAPYRLHRPDGTTRWVETRMAPLQDEDGRSVALFGATRDITALQETEAALRRALERERRAGEELREVGELKNALLAAVSHELRTPLTSVVGFAELLQRHDADLSPERRAMLLASLVRNARRLERLLGDLLDLDRLDRSVIEPVRRPTEVADLVARVVHRLEDADRIHLEVPRVVASLDGPKVERILENLLVNALKHTHEGSTVWVRGEVLSDGLVLVVEDDGPGVPDDLKPMVFDAFVRGAGTHRSHSPGTGIGLSLVARFAALHGGRAWVDDREGGGASFCVLLPDRPYEVEDDARRTPGS